MVLELARRVIVAMAVATTATAVVVRLEHQIKNHRNTDWIDRRKKRVLKWRRSTPPEVRKRILGWLLGQRTDPQSLPTFTIVENGLRFYNGVTQYCRA